MAAQRTRTASRARAEAERLRRERERTAKLMQKAERKRGLERTTERRPAWQKLSARARKALRDAERSLDPKVVAKLNDKARKLLEEADRLAKAPSKGLVERITALGDWRSTLDKPVFSLRLVSWFQDNGRWCQQADGTFSGDAHFRVPTGVIDTVEGEAYPRYDLNAFAQWLVDLTDGLEWMDKEPVWWAIGYTIAGEGINSIADRNRYDRIKGGTATISYWRKPAFLESDPTKTRMRRDGFTKMIRIWIDETARRIFDSGLHINKVSIFCHYGPTAPSKADEFNCAEEMPKQTVFLIEDQLKKRFLQTEGKAAFLVYDRRGRRYLQNKTYSGKKAEWNGKATAYRFATRAQARSSASNLNASRPKGRSYDASVVELTLPVWGAERTAIVFESRAKALNETTRLNASRAKATDYRAVLKPKVIRAPVR